MFWQISSTDETTKPLEDLPFLRMTDDDLLTSKTVVDFADNRRIRRLQRPRADCRENRAASATASTRS
jgi:hypothetical protein